MRWPKIFILMSLALIVLAIMHDHKPLFFAFMFLGNFWIGVDCICEAILRGRR